MKKKDLIIFSLKDFWTLRTKIIVFMLIITFLIMVICATIYNYIINNYLSYEIYNQKPNIKKIRIETRETKEKEKEILEWAKNNPYIENISPFKVEGFRIQTAQKIEEGIGYDLVNIYGFKEGDPILRYYPKIWHDNNIWKKYNGDKKAILPKEMDIRIGFAVSDYFLNNFITKEYKEELKKGEKYPKYLRVFCNLSKIKSKTYISIPIISIFHRNDYRDPHIITNLNFLNYAKSNLEGWYFILKNIKTDKHFFYYKDYIHKLGFYGNFQEDIIEEKLYELTLISDEYDNNEEREISIRDYNIEEEELEFQKYENKNDKNLIKFINDIFILNQKKEMRLKKKLEEIIKELREEEYIKRKISNNKVLLINFTKKYPLKVYKKENILFQIYERFYSDIKIYLQQFIIKYTSNNNYSINELLSRMKNILFLIIKPEIKLNYLKIKELLQIMSYYFIKPRTHEDIIKEILSQVIIYPKINLKNIKIEKSKRYKNIYIIYNNKEHVYYCIYDKKENEYKLYFPKTYIIKKVNNNEYEVKQDLCIFIRSYPFFSKKYLSELIKEKNSKREERFYAYIFAKTMEYVEKIKNECEKKFKNIMISEDQVALIKEYLKIRYFLKGAVISFLLIFSSLTLFIMYFIIREHLETKKTEISLLKVYGMSNINIYSIFILETLWINIISFIVSFIIFLIVNSYIKEVLSKIIDINKEILKFPWIYYILIFLIMFILEILISNITLYIFFKTPFSKHLKAEQ